MVSLRLGPKGLDVCGATGMQPPSNQVFICDISDAMTFLTIRAASLFLHHLRSQALNSSCPSPMAILVIVQAVGGMRVYHHATLPQPGLLNQLFLTDRRQ